MSVARELLGEISGSPALLTHLGDEDDLVCGGVNSGDLIRLVVELEERYGLEIDADDLDGLTTLADFDRLADRQLALHGANARALATTKGGPDMSGTETLTLDTRYTDNPALRCDNGMELYHELCGEAGPHITIVNNFSLICPMWRTFAPSLPLRNRVLTYDLRNQGASTGGLAEVSWTDHVDDLRALLDGLEIERTTLVGTSVSCLICRDFALAHPERVDGLVLVGPAFSPFGDRRRRAITRTWINALERSGTAGMWDELYAHVFTEPFMEAGGAPLYLGLGELFSSLFAVEPLRANLESSLSAPGDPELLRRLACPTLLVVGDADFAWTPAAVALTEALVPTIRSVVMPGAGHLPYLEDSASFEAIVQGFVDECQPAIAHANGGLR